MLILGIESSCDETSASVVEMSEEQRVIRSNIVASQIETHRLYGGVGPEIASRGHIEAISRITYEALSEAGIRAEDLGGVAVTSHPGLIGALLVGVNFAKSMAFSRHLPLVAVNHIHGHVAAAYLAHPDLEPPFLALVVSGGHTSFYRVDSYTDFCEIGGTRDDAAGEAFDKIGRVIGMPYPGGAALDRLAYEGDPHAIALPSPALVGDTLDLSFSGIKTATLNYLNGAKQKGIAINEADVAASYTHRIVEALVKKTARALEVSGMQTLVLAGGVAANSHLRAGLERLCAERGVRLAMPDRALCGDNGAMIAAAGYFELLRGNLADTSLNASASDDGL
jgi:N6-L-threonylcarbamoyladenine synthase